MGNSARAIAIGDIHGCLRTFRFLLEEILVPEKDDEIYLLGDYIDRGPEVKPLIDYIMKLQLEGYSLTTLMGNHEEMLLKSIDSGYYFDSWVTANGGYATLKSFNVFSAARMPEEYLDFFRRMPYYVELNDYILVHGGLNFAIPDPFEDKSAMLWQRSGVVDFSKTRGRKLIVGHTPISLERVVESFASNIIMLDGGCVYGRIMKGGGCLCAFDMKGQQLYYKENIENGI